jgi:hypothetical protein
VRGLHCLVHPFKKEPSGRAVFPEHSGQNRQTSLQWLEAIKPGAVLTVFHSQSTRVADDSMLHGRAPWIPFWPRSRSLFWVLPDKSNHLVVPSFIRTVPA